MINLIELLENQRRNYPLVAVYGDRTLATIPQASEFLPVSGTLIGNQKTQIEVEECAAEMTLEDRLSLIGAHLLPFPLSPSVSFLLIVNRKKRKRAFLYKKRKP